MTDKQRSFLIDVDDNPYTVLHQTHSATVAGQCHARGWVKRNNAGLWSITMAGAQALAVTA